MRYLMTTEVRPSNDRDHVLGLCKQLQGYEDTFEHHKPDSSLLAYVIQDSKNPNLDRIVCEQAGKVVHIIARFSTKEPVTIRGNNGPLSWGTDIASDSNHATLHTFKDAQTNEIKTFYERTFTLPVAPNNINDTLEFKFCTYDPSNNLTWSSGTNYSIDLRLYKHLSVIKVPAVTF